MREKLNLVAKQFCFKRFIFLASTKLLKDKEGNLLVFLFA